MSVTNIKKPNSARYDEPIRKTRVLCLVWLAVCFPSLVFCQNIEIRVVNGRNGKPVTNECLNISLGAWHGGDLVAPTSKDGVVVLHFNGNQVTTDSASPQACNGLAVSGPKTMPAGVDVITVSGDYYIACQEPGKVIPEEPAAPDLRQQLMPSYSIKTILESGLSASNICGKVRAEAKPGELVFYVRPRSFLEKMAQ